MRNPSGGLLLILLGKLARHDNSFLVIEPADSDGMTYMQTCVGRDGRLIVEYQVGSLDAHYESPRALSLDEAFEVLRQWAFGDPAWRTECAWVRQEL